MVTAIEGLVLPLLLLIFPPRGSTLVTLEQLLLEVVLAGLQVSSSLQNPPGWAQGSSSWCGVLLDLGLAVRLGRTLGVLPLP